MARFDRVRHAESIGLATRAVEDLARAADAPGYEDFAQARFGFREALSLWPENPAARTGCERACLEYARRAFDHEDYDRALELEPNNPDFRQQRDNAVKAKQAGGQ